MSGRAHRSTISFALATLFVPLCLLTTDAVAQDENFADPSSQAAIEAANECATIAYRSQGAAAKQPVDACLDRLLPQLDRLSPAERYTLALNTFTAFPCFGLGVQKERLVRSAAAAAQEIGDLDAAVLALYSHGVCYWNDKPAQFDKAMQSFAPFRNALAPYINPSILDSPDQIEREAFIFRDLARKYVRFVENANRIDVFKRLCGAQPNRCLEDAWTLTQRLKARMFHSRMLQVHASSDSSGGLVELLRRQYRFAQAREMSRVGIPISINGRPATPAMVSSEAAAVDADIARRFPDYARFAEDLSPTLDQIRSSLRDNEVYISYLFLDLRGIVAFKLTKGELPLFVRLDVDPYTMKRLISEIDEGVLEGASVETMAEVLRQGGSGLIDRLAIPTGARLIIEADEEMSALPFALLQTGRGLLGANHEITYVPSAGVFWRLRRGNLPPSGDLYLGFGRTKFPNRNPLPRVEEEIATTSAAIGNVGARNPEAQESEIYGLRSSLARARVLHLATHTDYADGHVALLFHEGNGQDGRLTETEILTRLRTPAELVILSACDTARLNEAGDVPGEAFSALARAFFATGARKLLVTQRAVRDRFAAPFVQHFMRSYAQDRDTARALKAAQSAVRAMPGATEQDWAAWILVGD